MDQDDIVHGGGGQLHAYEAVGYQPYTWVRPDGPPPNHHLPRLVPPPQPQYRPTQAWYRGTPYVTGAAPVPTPSNYLLTTGWSPPTTYRTLQRAEHEYRRLAEFPPRPEYHSRQVLQWPQRTNYDFRSLEYPEDVSSQLICPICRCPFIHPMSLPCEHMFCDDCLDEALKSSHNCPTCRQHFERSEVVKAPRVVSSLVDDLEAKCPNHERGCTVAVTRQTVISHRGESCEYEIVVCPHSSCSQFCERRQEQGPCIHRLTECEFCQDLIVNHRIDEHHRSECPSATRLCQNCGDSVRYSEFAGHLALCEPATVQCKASAFGCNHATGKLFIDAHEHECPLAKLAPFLQGQQQQIDAAQERYHLLHSRMQTYHPRLTALHENLENALTQLEEWRESIEAVGDTTMTCEAAIVGLTDAQTAIRAEMSLLRDSTTHWEGSLRNVQAEKDFMMAEMHWLHRSVQQLLNTRRRALPRISMNKSHVPLSSALSFNDNIAESSTASQSGIDIDATPTHVESPQMPLQTMRERL